MQDLVATVEAGLGLQTLRLPSGAGHDGQNVARLAPAGTIFVPSIQERSRCPAELSTWEGIKAGANVLLAMVHHLATA
jgi:N-carbamoyl-L-amino-acid hydrolase